jgi:hypothetical protein
MSGWIKLHRQLTDWEWYSDVNTSRLFIHLLLVANHKDGKWRGIEIKRGQRLTSLSKLADETNLSVKNIRTAIKRLKSTNEVASLSNAQHTVFTVVNYDSYQGEASQVASEGQAKGKQVATNKNDNNKDNKESVDYKKVKDIFNEYFCRGTDPISREPLLSAEIKQLTPKRKKAIDSFFNQTKLTIDKFESYIQYVSSNQSWLYFRKINTKNGIRYTQRPFDWYMTIDNYVKASEENTNNDKK